MYTKFYHATTKKMIAAFATIFDNVQIDLGNGKEITVPLFYTQGETFLYRLEHYKDDEGNIKPVPLPLMGFELTSMQYEPERHTNTVAKLQDKRIDPKRQYMFNRVPVGFNFDLHIAVKRLEDGLKIIEQIIPFFAPELVIRVKAVEELEQSTNIPVSLTSWSHQIINEGATSDQIRAVTFQLSFIMKGFLYPNVRLRKTVEEVIANMTEGDFEDRFQRLVVTSPDGVNLEVETQDLGEFL